MDLMVPQGDAAGAVTARNSCVHQDGAQKMGRGRRGGEHQRRMTMKVSTHQLNKPPGPYEERGPWLAMLSCCSRRRYRLRLRCGERPVISLAKKEKPALLETLKELFPSNPAARIAKASIRSRDVIAKRLGALGGKVEMIEPGPDAVRFVDTPEKIGKMVRATFTGTGSRRSC